MNPVFSIPPSVDDLRAGAVVLAAVGDGNFDAARLAMDAIRPADTFPIAETDKSPYGVWAVSGDLVVVALSGTASRLQAFLELLGSIQGPAAGVPGRVAGYFAAAAAAVREAIGPAVELVLPGRRLVLLGHSLGGAVAQILSTSWAAAAAGCVVLAYGAPRVGDAVFADAVSPYTFRVENTADPVVCIPPPVWAGQGSPWTWPLGVPIANYAHGGGVRTVDSQGVISDAENHLSLTQTWQMLVSQAWDAHEIKEYLRRLDQGAEWASFGPQFDDPPQLDAADAFLQPAGAGGPTGGATMLVQGLLFFRTTEESAGWSESWYADSSVPAMLTTLESLLKWRAAFLSNSCEIHAYRAAVVNATPATKLARAIRLDQPVGGKASALWGKLHPAAVETNETMDAVDFIVRSNLVGARKLCSFRGIDDAWINGTKLSDAGRGGLPVVKAYLAAVKAANLGIKVYDRNQPVKPMESITQDAATKLLTVTSTAHLLADRSIVTVRGCKSNPMVNGRWRITVVDPNTFRLNGSGKLYASANGDGTVQASVSVADTITGEFEFAMVSTRQTGRPFGMRRGKRSPRLLHH